MATLENSAFLFSLREFHDNLCSCIENKNLRFPAALVRQISLRVLPVNVETFSMDKSQELNYSELSPVQVLKSVTE